MEPFQVLWCLSLQVLDLKYFDVQRCFGAKNVFEFSLDISVTKSTLNDFVRWSNTISDTH